ncbi:Na+/H+ antiporter subunit E [Paenirhodobacter enshiensis]|uniref:Na+/H+ antiporter subunit E n=1 Tax=Paenirhodobacter enshiensis TaxID=1105367 RepID=UPI0035B0C2BA
MKRLLPHPVLSLALVLMWLLLTRFSLGQLLLGGAVALVAGRALATIEPEGPRIRPGALWRVVPLTAVVFADILKSNLLVARRILRGARAPSGFVRVPLRLRGPMPLAVLALILTATPGSAWMSWDEEKGELLVHILELDGTDWPALIRDRYEAPLLEIFA